MTITTASHHHFTFKSAMASRRREVPLRLKTAERSDHWMEISALCFVLLLGFLSNVWDLLILAALGFCIVKLGFVAGRVISESLWGPEPDQPVTRYAPSGRLR